MLIRWKLKLFVFCTFVGLLLLLMIMGSFVSSAFVIVSTPKPIEPPTPKMSSLYDKVSKQWMDKAIWTDPVTGEEREGLTLELKEQIEELDMGLSSGLLKALSEFRGHYRENEAKQFSELLSPRSISVEEFTVSEKQVEIIRQSDGTSIAKDDPPTEYTVYRITSLTTYRGDYRFQYEMVPREYILDADFDNNGEAIRVLKNIVTGPVIKNESFEEDYFPLLMAMKGTGLRGKIDMQLLFRQSLAFDPYFNDPRALSMLPRLDGDGAIGFTGEYSNGEYSLDTVITEYSGVTLDQIQTILKGTPMERSAAAFMKAGKQYGIDPAFLVGIAGAEQSFKPFHNNAFGITGRGDAGTACVKHACFAAYSSVDVGIYAAARLLSGPLYVQDGRVTIEDIWHRWAPGEATNDPNGLNSNWAKNVINVMARVKSL